MNNLYSTQGLPVLVVNSQEVIVCRPNLNFLPWNIATANLLLYDPFGNLTTIPAAVGPDGYSASAGWTVTNVPGIWARVWQVTGVNGRTQYSLGLGFIVKLSPA